MVNILNKVKSIIKNEMIKIQGGSFVIFLRNNSTPQSALVWDIFTLIGGIIIAYALISSAIKLVKEKKGKSINFVAFIIISILCLLSSLHSFFYIYIYLKSLL